MWGWPGAAGPASVEPCSQRGDGAGVGVHRMGPCLGRRRGPGGVVHSLCGGGAHVSQQPSRRSALWSVGHCTGKRRQRGCTDRREWKNTGPVYVTGRPAVVEFSRLAEAWTVVVSASSCGEESACAVPVSNSKGPRVPIGGSPSRLRCSL